AEKSPSAASPPKNRVPRSSRRTPRANPGYRPGGQRAQPARWGGRRGEIASVFRGGRRSKRLAIPGVAVAVAVAQAAVAGVGIPVVGHDHGLPDLVVVVGLLEVGVGGGVLVVGGGAPIFK
nr:hypothetical protein [Tanacetum cinerariifolium]